MLKVNINNHILYLLPQKNIKQVQASGELGPIWRWVEINGGKEQTEAQILTLLDVLDGSNAPIAVVGYAKNFRKLLQIFKGLYKVQEAAGGMVWQAETGKVLGIYRRGSWDMPKGKAEKGESIEQTAVREVQEETGLINIDLQDFITTTYHVFWQNNPKSKAAPKRMLKVSHWYRMTTTDVDLIPQTEEDIEEIAWLDYEEFLAKKPIFTNILDVLNLGQPLENQL